MGKNPNLTDPSQWSEDLQDFITQCINRDPKARPMSETLLKHPFIHKAKNCSLSDGFMIACKSLEKKQDPSELNASGSLIVGAPVSSSQQNKIAGSKLAKV